MVCIAIFLQSSVWSYYLTTFFLAYTLVKERSGCKNGGGVLMGKLPIGDCCNICKTKASMFVFGRRRSSQCDGIRCLCYCSVNASPNGSCVPRPLSTFDLYRINDVGGNFEANTWHICCAIL